MALAASAIPGSANPPSSSIRATFYLFRRDQPLLGLQGVNRYIDRSPFEALVLESTHPKQCASSKVTG